MRKHGLLGAHLALCVGLGMSAISPDTGAKPKPKDKEEAVEPGKLTQTPSLKPKGLKFGMSPKKVYAVYDKAIERDYLKKYRDVEPGIQMQRLDYSKKQKKDAFRLSYIAFDNPPSSLDGTKLATEFTYGNGEGMMKIKRKRKRRSLFFIKNRLWNIVDVYKLKAGGKWGPTFKSAVEKVEKKLKVPGLLVEANPDEGVPYSMVQWDDGKTWLRMMDWGKKVAISYSDLKTVKKLADLRKSKTQKKREMDPSVKSVLRTPKDTSGKTPKGK